MEAESSSAKGYWISNLGITDSANVTTLCPLSYYIVFHPNLQFTSYSSHSSNPTAPPVWGCLSPNRCCSEQIPVVWLREVLFAVHPKAWDEIECLRDTIWVYRSTGSLFNCAINRAGLIIASSRSGEIFAWTYFPITTTCFENSYTDSSILGNLNSNIGCDMTVSLVNFQGS